MPYIYGENNQYASVRLDRQAAFKSSKVWYVRAGKGLIPSVFLPISFSKVIPVTDVTSVIVQAKEEVYFCMLTNF